MGLSLAALRGLTPSERASRLDAARKSLSSAGADLVIDSVADLVPALERVSAV